MLLGVKLTILSSAPPSSSSLVIDIPCTQLVELRMYQLSATIREKPEWWRKFKDPEIRKKWFEEAKAQQAEVEERWRLTDNMVRVQLIDVPFVLMACSSTTRLASWRATRSFGLRRQASRSVAVFSLSRRMGCLRRCRRDRTIASGSPTS